VHVVLYIHIKWLVYIIMLVYLIMLVCKMLISYYIKLLYNKMNIAMLIYMYY